MKILVLNAGSSSVKFELLEVGAPAVHRPRSVTLLAGAVDRIGPGASLSVRNSVLNEREAVPVKDHYDAVAKIIASCSRVIQARSTRLGIVWCTAEIALAHRF